MDLGPHIEMEQMETKANYLLVGILVVVAVISIFMFCIWFAGGPHKAQYTQVMIYFPGSVSGLSPGSPVRYRGVQVGNVNSITLDKDKPDEVQVLVNILKTTPLREGMRADLQMLGITGLSFIELTAYNTNAGPLTIHDHAKYPIIYGSESALETMMENIPKLLQSYSDVAYSILDTLSPENRLAMHDSLQSLSEFSKNLNETQQDIDEILANVQVIVGRTDEFSQTGFMEMQGLLHDARKAANDISTLSETLNQNPSSLIFQPAYQGHQIK